MDSTRYKSAYKAPEYVDPATLKRAIGHAHFLRQNDVVWDGVIERCCAAVRDHQHANQETGIGRGVYIDLLAGDIARLSKVNSEKCRRAAREYFNRTRLDIVADELAAIVAEEKERQRVVAAAKHSGKRSPSPVVNLASSTATASVGQIGGVR